MDKIVWNHTKLALGLNKGVGYLLVAYSKGKNWYISEDSTRRIIELEIGESSIWQHPRSNSLAAYEDIALNHGKT